MRLNWKAMEHTKFARMRETVVEAVERRINACRRMLEQGYEYYTTHEELAEMWAAVLKGSPERLHMQLHKMQEEELLTGDEQREILKNYA